MTVNMIEVLIAILWYLQIMFVGVTYTVEEVDMMIITNQPVIEQVQNDQQLLNTILDNFNSNYTITIENGAVDIWDDPPPSKPIKMK